MNLPAKREGGLESAGIHDRTANMTRKDGRAFAVAVALFAAFFGVVFFRALRSGEYLIAPSDALDFGVADYLSAPSYWTEGLYSGYPIAADPQSLIWYPVL